MTTAEINGDAVLPAVPTMQRFTLFHRASGAIIGNLAVPTEADAELYQTAALGVCAGLHDPETEYVIDGSPLVVAVRQNVTFNAPAAVTVGTPVTITGLPASCYLQVDGEVHQVTGGSVSRTPTLARVITIELVGAYRGSATIVVHSAPQAALNADAKWTALLAATPQQIENWLAANVTTLAEARDVLKLLLLAVRR